MVNVNISIAIAALFEVHSAAKLRFLVLCTPDKNNSKVIELKK